MNAKLENEINSEEEINLYDYWKVLVKRKKILIGIFLVPLVIASAISLSLPRYYRGEAEISYPVSPVSPVSPVMTAPNIVRLIGNIDDTKKVKIFTKNSDAIKNVSVSLTKKFTDKVTILVDAKTADIIPQAFKDIVDYISNMPEFKEENARIKEENDLNTEGIIAENDLKLPKLIEARKANLIFLNQMTDMMKKRQLTFININPADLIKKDAELSLEIMNLQKAKKDLMIKKPLTVKVAARILSPLSIAKQPSNSQIKQWIIITGLLSLFIGIFVVFFLEYIDRMKARENK